MKKYLVFLMMGLVIGLFSAEGMNVVNPDQTPFTSWMIFASVSLGTTFAFLGLYALIVRNANRGKT